MILVLIRRRQRLMFLATFSLLLHVSFAFILSPQTCVSNGGSSQQHFNSIQTNLYSQLHHYQHGYRPASNSGPLPINCKLTEEQIHTLLTKRIQNKRQRNYADADKILIALNKCGIYIHDKRKEYRLDGKNHFGRSQQYIRRGGTYHLSDEDVKVVSQMVEDRSYAKKKREYHRSDEIGEKLKMKYNIKLDDKNREWSVVAKEGKADLEEGEAAAYVPSPIAPSNHPTHTMDNEIKLQITKLLSERTTFRICKEYKMADQILDELFEKYSVVADDRTKEWKVVDNEIGGLLEDDEFVKGAQLSQRSAFARRQTTGGTARRGEDTSKDTTSAQEVVVIHDDDDDDDDDNDTILSTKEGKKKGRIDLESLTVVELKEQLREEGLPVSGKKADLVLRLSSNL